MPDNLPLHKIGKGSHYLHRLLQNPVLHTWLFREKGLLRSYPLPELYQELVRIAKDCDDFRSLQLDFRLFKQRHFLRIGGREIMGLEELPRTVQEISNLATVCLQVGVEFLFERPWLWLTPNKQSVWEQGYKAVTPVVMAMGKLGGQELNYVSDIDLIFLYDFSGDMEQGISGEWPGLLRTFFQTLCRLLDDVLGGDRVFKVDLRLRPLGKDGEICCPVEGAVNYYQIAGQAWERQALLKARPVAGDRSLGQHFLSEIRPFVFRRFLDFQAITELRQMRDRILEEHQPKEFGPGYDLKLGKGGIREIEFMVQSFQLIYGGRLVELDDPNTLSCLSKLKEAQLVPADVAHKLADAYQFLRRAEHWVQLDQNRQTSRLPVSLSDLERMARTLGFTGQTDQLFAALAEKTGFVFSQFSQLFSNVRPELSRDEGSMLRTGGAVEGTGPGPEELELWFAENVISSSAGSDLGHALQYFSGPLVHGVKLSIWSCLDGQGSAKPHAEGVLRIARWLQKVRRRPGLVHLLEHGGEWIRGLFSALYRSAFVFDLLWLQPALIEGLSWGPGQGPDPRAWTEATSSVLKRTSSFEEALGVVRKGKNEFVLQTALYDLQGARPVDEIGCLLSFVAQKVLEWTLGLLVRELFPEGDSTFSGLAVLALGKLGSGELGYLSDLDLMFVWGKDGQDRLPGQVTRLVQRLLSMLSVPLQDGPGYKTDARLRPSGKAGPLIVTAGSWEDYYSCQADLWEVQSLLRMRAIGADMVLGKRLQESARAICFQDRSLEQVWSRLAHFRLRMERERSPERGQEEPSVLDIKLGLGGLADLEFLAQGVQLVWGKHFPELQTSMPGQVLEVISSQDLPGLSKLRELPLAEWYADLRRLALDWQLFANRQATGIVRQDMDECLSLGYSGALDWPDLIHMKKAVRQAWLAACQTR